MQKAIGIVVLLIIVLTSIYIVAGVISVRRFQDIVAGPTSDGVVISHRGAPLQNVSIVVNDGNPVYVGNIKSTEFRVSKDLIGQDWAESKVDSITITGTREGKEFTKVNLFARR